MTLSHLARRTVVSEMPDPNALKLQRYQRLINTLASAFERLYQLQPDEPHYLVGKRYQGTRTWIDLAVCSHTQLDQHPEYTLVCPEYLPKHLTLEGKRARLRSWLEREPLWIFADT
jgi:hypothetical protein